MLEDRMLSWASKASLKGRSLFSCLPYSVCCILSPKLLPFTFRKVLLL